MAPRTEDLIKLQQSRLDDQYALEAQEAAPPNPPASGGGMSLGRMLTGPTEAERTARLKALAPTPEDAAAVAAANPYAAHASVPAPYIPQLANPATTQTQLSYGDQVDAVATKKSAGEFDAARQSVLAAQEGAQLGQKAFAIQSLMHQAQMGNDLIDLENERKEYQSRFDETRRQLDDINRELDTTEITPAKFFSSRTAFQKISLFVGVLADAARNLSPNYDGKQVVLPMIERAIERDIAVQEANLRNKQQRAGMAQNALGVYMQKLGSLDLAKQGLRAAMYDSVTRVSQSFENRLGNAIASGNTTAMLSGKYQESMNSLVAAVKPRKTVTRTESEAAKLSPEQQQQYQAYAVNERMSKAEDEIIKDKVNAAGLEKISSATGLLGTVMDSVAEKDKAGRWTGWTGLDNAANNLVSNEGQLAMGAAAAASGKDFTPAQMEIYTKGLRPALGTAASPKALVAKLDHFLKGPLRESDAQLNRLKKELAAKHGGKIPVDASGKEILPARIAEIANANAAARRQWDLLRKAAGVE